MSYIKNIILSVVVLASLPLGAQYYNSLSNKPQHYLMLSLQGGESNSLSKAQEGINLKDKAGAGAGFDFSYEVEYHRFFFDAGLTVDYGYTGQWLDSLVETDSRITADYEGHEVEYQYVYDDLLERQHRLSAGLRIAFGYWFHQYVYGSVGAKLKIPVLAMYNTDTRLLTQGVYDFGSEPLRSIPEIGRDLNAYGYYADSDFSYKSDGGKAIRAALPELALTAEIGGRIPLKSKKTGMRAGVFAEYAMPIGSVKRGMLGVYDKVNSDPSALTEADMRQNLALNSVLDTELLKRNTHFLTVGVRLTVMFNVTRDAVPCRCTPDW